MEHQFVEYFDVPTLLKVGDLGVRSFAKTYTISVSDYFGLLSEYLYLSEEVSRDLKRFTARDFDKEGCKRLSKIAKLLKSFGYEKFSASIYSIIGAYENGNWKLAATYAEKLIDDFNELYNSIHKAIRKSEPVKSFNKNYPLRDFIKYLDEEEANRRLLILAVDDSPVILKSVSAVLDADYKVFCLPKSVEIEKVLQKLTPDLILLDYLMPDINGFELIPMIRNFEAQKNTPIIFLTSEGTIDNITAACALGACDFIVKPFKPDILLEKVEKQLKK